MLVLSKFDNIRNISVTFESDNRENIAKSTHSLALRPWTLNVLNDEEEKVFEHARKSSPELKHWLAEGQLRVIALGAKRDQVSEDAAAADAEEKAQDAAAELEAAKPAAKAKAQKAYDKAKAEAVRLRALADSPAGVGDSMPKTLDKIEDSKLAAEMVEGVIDLPTLNAYLRAEKRTNVQRAITAQIKRVEEMESKAKELQGA